MNSAPADVPCTQNSEAARPERSATSPTPRLNALEPAWQGGGRTITVPNFTKVPAVTRTVVVLPEAWAVSMAPPAMLSAVTIDVSADSTVVAIRTVFPNLSAARALSRKTSPIPSSRTVSRERIICARGPAIAIAVKVTGLSPVTGAVAVWLPTGGAGASPPPPPTTTGGGGGGEGVSVPDDVLQATETPDRFWSCESKTLTVSGCQACSQPPSCLARRPTREQRWPGAGLRAGCIPARDHEGEDRGSKERDQSRSEPHVCREGL